MEYDLSVENVFSDGGREFHTSSLMYRMEHGRIIHSEKRPDFFNKTKRVGDYPKAIYLAIKGEIHFFPDIMSVYRLGTSGSWTKSIENRKNLLEMQYSLIEMLKSVDDYTVYRFHETIIKIIEQRYLKILDKETSISVLTNREIRAVIKKQNIKKRIKIYIKVLWLNKKRARKK